MSVAESLISLKRGKIVFKMKYLIFHFELQVQLLLRLVYSYLLEWVKWEPVQQLSLSLIGNAPCLLWWLAPTPCLDWLKEPKCIEEGLEYKEKQSISWPAKRTPNSWWQHTCSLYGWQVVGDLLVGNSNIFLLICNFRYHSHEPPTPRHHCFCLGDDDYGSFWQNLAE